MYVNGEQGYRLSETCPSQLKAIQIVILATTLSAESAMSSRITERLDG